MVNHFSSKLFIFLIMFLSCSKPQWDGKISYNNGVIFVENNGKPLNENPTIKLVLKYQIEGKSKLFDGEPLDKIRDIAVDTSGSLYVSDGSNCRILVFDSNGIYRRAFGNKGEGPGEFLNPISISFDEKNFLYVLDQKLRRVSQFTKDGKFQRSIPFHEMALDIAVKDSNHIYLSILSFLTKNFLIKQYNISGESLKSFCKKLESSNNVSMAGEFGKIWYSNDAVYYAFAYPYRIEKYDYSGREQMVITLFKKEFTPPSLPQKIKGFNMILGGSLAAKITGLAVLKSGIIVVNSYFKNKEVSLLDFFLKDGKYLQSLKLPQYHILGCVYNGLLYTYIKGFNDFPAVTCWKIKR